MAGVIKGKIKIHPRNTSGCYQKVKHCFTPAVAPYGVKEIIAEQGREFTIRTYVNPVRGEFDVTLADYTPFKIKGFVFKHSLGTVKSSDGEHVGGVVTMYVYPFDGYSIPVISNESSTRLADYLEYDGSLWKAMKVDKTFIGAGGEHNTKEKNDDYFYTVEFVLSKTSPNQTKQDNMHYGHYTG